ncbi:right-handed parallel beta-helix repeat-containing protein [Bifidobacterium tsurumiense]|uniref:Right handed beta helix domain-containing protein n=1 Tax=Bifidobacterium tsurumiense TaxID=356829 RepID=A0A087EKB8_9BIFI|nr:right-handed parallel beta-helix repeat-containing protein [Bifidobacterium tsurumiense]KFJ08219.1 hypothetical protein BITS_0554 [Bifidobacterium tsurumiense]
MTTIYISAAHGDDANAGTDPGHAWATLSPANSFAFKPGDALLLERGSIFSDQFLHISASGTPEEPICIGAYGDETRPFPAIHANGSGRWFQDYRAPIGGSPHRNRGEVSTALLLMDCSYIEVRDLEITNRRVDDSDGLVFNARNVMDRTGVAVIAQDGGTSRHVLLEGLYIHDVDGNVYDKHMANGGIYCMAHFPTDTRRITDSVARFDDLSIRDCTVRNVRRWGIAVGYTAYLNFIDRGGLNADGEWNNTFDYGDGSIDDSLIATFGSTNIVIEGNTVEDAGGDGITVMYCDRPIVRRNISRRAAKDIRSDIYNATENDRVAAAIWPWRCKNALFEYNEAYDTLNAEYGNGDGQAWDADFGDGTVYRNNYSSGNSGGSVMFCNEKAVNSHFYHNVAYHDRLGAIDIPRNPDADIHDNVFILDESCDPIRNDNDRADGTAHVQHNIFINDAPQERLINWHPHAAHIIWQDNLYVRFANRPSEES